MSFELPGEEWVYDIAGRLKPEMWVDVIYDSTRGEGEFVMSGQPTSVYVRREGMKMKFVRGDGQTIYIQEDGKLYSEGSHYPNNGPVVGVRLVEDGTETEIRVQ